jgi:alkaline phosphatase
MIGDGMGAVDIVLTEKHNKEKCFDFGLVLNQIKNTGFATTYSANSKVTDSAASGTALATGIKTNNGYVGKDTDGNDVLNASEIARQLGKKVGIVTNDSITGATPSAFTVHNISRNNTEELAKSFVKFMPDVLIGQGYTDFAMLDLSAAIFAKDILKYNTVLNKDKNCEKPFVGFFSEDISINESNTLAYVTEVALNRLSKNNDKGFFLMVENAGTDKAGHNNVIKGKVNGVVTFDRAVAVVLKFMKENPDTLLVITSDHETGGVLMSKDDKLTNLLFTSNGHTATDVRTFALGYGTEYFGGKTVDNTDIAKFVINAIKN